MLDMLVYFVANLPQHLLSKNHENERAVKEILQLDPTEGDDPETVKEKKEKRKKLLDMLRLKGSHMHNRKVIEEKHGELILGGRPVELDVRKYVPCPNCKEWIKDAVIDRHQASCIGMEEDNPKQSKGSLVVQGLFSGTK